MRLPQLAQRVQHRQNQGEHDDQRCRPGLAVPDQPSHQRSGQQDIKGTVNDDGKQSRVVPLGAEQLSHVVPPVSLGGYGRGFSPTNVYGAWANSDSPPGDRPQWVIRSVDPGVDRSGPGVQPERRSARAPSEQDGYQQATADRRPAEIRTGAVMTAKSATRNRLIIAGATAGVVAAGVVGVVTVQAQDQDPATRTPVVVNAADADLAQSTHLSIAAATKAAQTALDAAAKENQRVSVAVVDRNGNRPRGARRRGGGRWRGGRPVCAGRGRPPGGLHRRRGVGGRGADPAAAAAGRAPWCCSARRSRSTSPAGGRGRAWPRGRSRRSGRRPRSG